MGRLSEKSFREVPKSEATPIPIATIPKMTSKIAPIMGIPRERSLLTRGLAITEMKIANKNGIKISLDARIPATTTTIAAKLKSTCWTWLGLEYEFFAILKLKINKIYLYKKILFNSI